MRMADEGHVRLKRDSRAIVDPRLSEVHPAQVARWGDQLVAEPASLFSHGAEILVDARAGAKLAGRLVERGHCGFLDSESVGIGRAGRHDADQLAPIAAV